MTGPVSSLTSGHYSLVAQNKSIYTDSGCDTVVAGRVSQVAIDSRDIPMQSKSVLSKTVVDSRWSRSTSLSKKVLL